MDLVFSWFSCNKHRNAIRDEPKRLVRRLSEGWHYTWDDGATNKLPLACMHREIQELWLRDDFKKKSEIFLNSPNEDGDVHLHLEMVVLSILLIFFFFFSVSSFSSSPFFSLSSSSLLFIWGESGEEWKWMVCERVSGEGLILHANISTSCWHVWSRGGDINGKLMSWELNFVE